MLKKPPIVTVYTRDGPSRSFCFLGDIPANVRAAVLRKTRSSADSKLLDTYYGDIDVLGAGIKSAGIKSGGDGDAQVLGLAILPAASMHNASTLKTPHVDVIRIFGNIYDIECVRVIASQVTRREIIDTDAVTPPTPQNPVCIGAESCGRIYPILGVEHADTPAIILTRAQLETARCIPESGLVARGNSGNSVSGGDIALDDIEMLLNEKPSPARTQSVQQYNMLSFEPGIEYVTDIHMYAEDRYSEVADKIYLATGIPVYRQHLFYVQTDDHANVTYTLFSDGIHDVDIRNNQNNKNNTNATRVYGLPIDRDLYDNRHAVSVHAQDTFMTLASTWEQAQPRLFVADLAAWLAPARASIDEMLRDEYQFDLVYYGFVLKYWPRLTRACFRDYVIDESDLYSSYPELARPRAQIRSVYAAERAIVDAGERVMTRALGASNIVHAITQITCMVNKTQISLNIRNLFDALACSEAMPEIRARVEHGGGRYMLTKRYNYVRMPPVFPTGLLASAGILIALVGAAGTVFLNILPHGRYYVRGIWPEEDHMDFPDAVAALARAVAGPIGIINDMGRSVFALGKSLPVLSAANIEYTGINVAMFWKRVMLESAFRAVKAAFDPYITAQILTPRNAGFDRAEYMFRKGMYEFDPTVLDRILGTFNQYMYLSDQTVRQKWVQQYDGRIVRAIHRTTDIKFEIVNVRETEFKTIYAYLAAFIYQIELPTGAPTSTVRKLRKLREQDPELYNIKKHGATKVYSRVCQKKQQPTIYTADEIAEMPARDVARLIKYWNFTLNKPAYYMCPNRKFPHLSFITGVHPKHYCLPCCNKRPHVDNKKQRTIDTCLATHMYRETNDMTTHRHVIRYGKVLEPGRVSGIPDGAMSTLLRGTTTVPHQWYVYGVQQNNFGMLHAAAACLEMTPHDLTERLVGVLLGVNAAPVFNSLLGGAIAMDFATAQELVVALRTYETALLSRFVRFTDLVVELLYADGVSVYEFIDAAGDGSNINLVSRRDIATQPRSIVILVVNGRYYPMFLMDIDNYFKTGHVYSRMYSPKHKIITLINRIRGFGNDVTHTIDYTRVVGNVQLDVGMDTPNGMSMVLRKYINRHNQCYAVLVQVQSGAVYLSLDPSPNVPDGVGISFDVVEVSDITGSQEHLRELMARVGMTVDMSLDAPNGTSAGILIADGGYECYYASDNLQSRVKTINAVILRGDPPADHVEFTNAYNRALYTKFSYLMFVNEFVRVVNLEVNTLVRDALKTLVRETNFTKGAAEFRRRLIELIGDYPDDIKLIRSQIMVNRRGVVDKTAVCAQIDEYTYDFDRMSIRDLSSDTQSHHDVVLKLRPLCTRFAIDRRDLEKTLPVVLTAFPNIYSACIDGGPHCHAGKLVVDDLDANIDLLAADLTNSIKRKYILTGLFMEIIIDYFDFIKRAGETIYVERVTDFA